MKLAVMQAADWDDELVAHSASEGPRLGKREVMRIRRRPAAYKARLPGHELPVLLIAQANRLAQGADCSLLSIARIRPTGRHHVSEGDRIECLASALAIADGRESRLKFLFDNSGIPSCKRVFGGKILTCPDGRLVG